MKEVNYIKHLNAVFDQFSKDSHLNPTHISLYMALFQIWNNNRFPESFHINREEVMKLSKVGSKSTYHRCLKELDNHGYIFYRPSHNPFKGSKIKMLKFGTTSGQVVDLNSPISGQAVGPLYKHIQTNKNLNKQQGFKNSNSQNEETSSNFKATVPKQDNLQVTNNKNYNEPL